MLAEQCRRLGVEVEASSSQTAALAQASNGAAASRKKPGWNLDIRSIQRRIKADSSSSSSNSSSSRLQASGAASECPEQMPLPPGWEVSHLHGCYPFLQSSHDLGDPSAPPCYAWIGSKHEGLA